MEKYFLRYGCYLGMDSIVDEYENEEEALQDAYELAYQSTEGWYGMHGFGMSHEEENDFMEEYGEEALSEEVHQIVDNACEWYAELYDPEQHDGYL